MSPAIAEREEIQTVPLASESGSIELAALDRSGLGDRTMLFPQLRSLVKTSLPVPVLVAQFGHIKDEYRVLWYLCKKMA